MKSIGAIPARWASTRFPGKILAELVGKPMIQHVWQQAKKAVALDEVIIACDEDHVRKACEGFGARVVMTSSAHESGTDRIAEAVADIDADIVVNIQGDEPLISPEVIDDLVRALERSSEISMATVIKTIDNEEDLANPNVVKAVVDQQGHALYFSRYAIPFNRDKKPFAEIRSYKHFGLYAYRRDFLLKFKELAQSHLERTERLEQLRVLEAGYKIITIQTDQDSVAVDSPEDLQRAAQLIGEGYGKTS